LYRYIGKLRFRSDIRSSGYDLVVDGFPRSGNTYCWLMLEKTQEARIKVKALTHLPPVLILSIRQHRPTCLCLRSPVEASASWVLSTGRSIKSVLRYYIDFHTVLLAYRSDLLILPFRTITGDFSEVLRLLKARFGMDLNVPSDCRPFQQLVVAQIDHLYSGEKVGKFELRVARPHPNRDLRKAALYHELQTDRYRPLLEECERLHGIFECQFKLNSVRLRGNEVSPSAE
jgi:hypothetical protein